MDPERTIAVLWGLWILSWFAAARWSNRTEKRPGVGTEIRYRTPLVIGAALVFVRWNHPALRLWHPGPIGAWACAAATAAGFAFTWWARIHLGRLWSASITRKADHRIVDTGPYALVRHPIYTGMLTALLATAIANGTATAIAGFGLMMLGIWMKARYEEAWLGQELGEAAYAEYRKRVPMLVPFT